MRLAELNRLERERFVDEVGGAWEASPWVAATAWDRRPFGSVEALHAAMTAAVREADGDRQLALIRAHPDLAGRAAAEGRLTAASTREQAAAGLGALSPADLARFGHLNAAYRARFGFPFVVCARDHTAATILDAFEQRLGHDREREVRVALEEIARIARLRLVDLVEEA